LLNSEPLTYREVAQRVIDDSEDFNEKNPKVPLSNLEKKIRKKYKKKNL
jgi:hypothetical protein